MSRPVIALLTDFGLRDHYTGTMKGVVLGICPDVTLVDITHEVPPQDVLSGALALAAAYRYFPAGTIFVVVIDPGVGSARKAIAAEAGGYTFVGPDNGVFGVAFEEQPPRLIVEISNPRYARAAISQTFEGRDRFAPAAAWIAAGVDLSSLGPPVDRLVSLAVPSAQVSGGVLCGEIVQIDRFGNLITNIQRRQMAAFASGGTMRVAVSSRMLPRVVATYADVPVGALCALVGSTERLEIAVNGGSAERELGIQRGAPVHVHRGA